MCNVFTMYIIIYNYCILAHLLAVLVLMPAALANRQMMFHIFVTGRQEQSILPYNYWYVSVFRSYLLEKMLLILHIPEIGTAISCKIKRSRVWPCPILK